MNLTRQCHGCGERLRWDELSCPCCGASLLPGERLLRRAEATAIRPALGRGHISLTTLSFRFSCGGKPPGEPLEIPLSEIESITVSTESALSRESLRLCIVPAGGLSCTFVLRDEDLATAMQARWRAVRSAGDRSGA
ncbi:hypothetical protein JW921_10835 [Candidatus Fermentibacterales bacterium]|nr:hypothetical protein [Candidatus Fermentibacterales bacterium]